MVRKRTSTSVVLKTDWKYWNGSWWEYGSGQLNNQSTCVDDVHPGFRLAMGDLGGTLDVSSVTYQVQPASGKWYRFWNNEGETSGTVYTGLLYENFNGQPNLKPSETDLLSLGATAVSRSLPTNPSFSLARAIGELRADGLPKVPGQTLRERARYLRNSGDEYLNVEFGWLPLVSDLRSFAKAVKHSHETLESFRKGSDRKIRKRYLFPTSTWSQMNQAGVNGVGNAIPWPHLHSVNSYGSSGAHLRTVSNETWFSGAFRYHIPLGNSLPEKFGRWRAEADKILGVELTPETVWQLTPWTWALDWFSNAGDVIHNINALGHDGLVMEYGYVMSKDITTDVVTAKCDYLNQWTKYESVNKTLRRRAASPYGFGFDMKTLTASQDAVLVALGLSHGLR